MNFRVHGVADGGIFQPGGIRLPDVDGRSACDDLLRLVGKHDALPVVQRQHRAVLPGGGQRGGEGHGQFLFLRQEEKDTYRSCHEHHSGALQQPAVQPSRMQPLLHAGESLHRIRLRPSPAPTGAEHSASHLPESLLPFRAFRQPLAEPFPLLRSQVPRKVIRDVSLFFFRHPVLFVYRIVWSGARAYSSVRVCRPLPDKHKKPKTGESFPPLFLLKILFCTPKDCTTNYYVLHIGDEKPYFPY